MTAMVTRQAALMTMINLLLGPAPPAFRLPHPRRLVVHKRHALLLPVRKAHAQHAIAPTMRTAAVLLHLAAAVPTCPWPLVVVDPPPEACVHFVCAHTRNASVTNQCVCASKLLTAVLLLCLMQFSLVVHAAWMPGLELQKAVRPVNAVYTRCCCGISVPLLTSTTSGRVP